MKDAQRDLQLPINMGSHTMRKTFATLFYKFSESSQSSANSHALEMVQIVLRHSSTKDSARYLGITQNRTGAIREMISDWMLGKLIMEDLTI
jgi:integrase